MPAPVSTTTLRASSTSARARAIASSSGSSVAAIVFFYSSSPVRSARSAPMRRIASRVRLAGRGSRNSRKRTKAAVFRCITGLENSVGHPREMAMRREPHIMRRGGSPDVHRRSSSIARPLPIVRVLRTRRADGVIGPAAVQAFTRDPEPVYGARHRRCQPGQPPGPRLERHPRASARGSVDDGARAARPPG